MYLEVALAMLDMLEFMGELDALVYTTGLMIPQSPPDDDAGPAKVKVTLKHVVGILERSTVRIGGGGEG
jgi:hypothetical protein